MKNIIIISILFLNLVAFSQKHELGKVTIEELKEKVCPIDTSAAAAFLFNVGKTTFGYSGDDGFQIITEINTKIKIYKKEGYEFANGAVNFYIGDRGSEKIDISKAITYNLVGDKIEKTKLKSDGEFTEKLNKNWNRKKIAMPNVKEGSIIEYKIIITSPYTSNFPNWEFQKDIPVNYSEYTTFIPEYFTYNTYPKGYLSPQIQKEVKPKKIDYTYVLSKDQILKQGLSTGRVNSTLEFNETIVKYFISNIQALKEEAFVNNRDNYRAGILHEIAGTRFPNGDHKDYSASWESVTNTIYKNQNFGDELKKTGYFEKDFGAIINGSNSQEEKITSILNYLKSRMNWNGNYGIYCDDGVKKAYQEKKGNVAEINLMLTAMLRYAGIEANPILVSTRSNGISLFPSRTSFNYVICGVELQNNVLLLDATNKNSLTDIIPIRALNWSGRIIRKNESSAEIDLTPKSKSAEVVNIMAKVNPEGVVSGKIRHQYLDYNAFLFRDKNGELAKDSYIEKLEKKHQGLEISEYDVLNVKDLAKPVVEDYSFTFNNAVESIGNKMYLSPFLFFALTENPFKQDNREYPIDFVFPNQNKFNISLTIPEGYIVETLPQPKAITMPDNISKFIFNISNNGNQIQAMCTMEMNVALIIPENYETIKKYFKEIVDKQIEKIVLKKSQNGY
jgi:hypothetical protein